MKSADPQAAVNDSIRHLSQAIDGMLLIISLEDLPGGSVSSPLLLRTISRHHVVAPLECATHGILGATHTCAFSCPFVMSRSSVWGDPPTTLHAAPPFLCSKKRCPSTAQDPNLSHVTVRTTLQTSVPFFRQ